MAAAARGRRRHDRPARVAARPPRGRRALGAGRLGRRRGHDRPAHDANPSHPRSRSPSAPSSRPPAAAPALAGVLAALAAFWRPDARSASRRPRGRLARRSKLVARGRSDSRHERLGVGWRAAGGWRSRGRSPGWCCTRRSRSRRGCRGCGTRWSPRRRGTGRGGGCRSRWTTYARRPLARSQGRQGRARLLPAADRPVAALPARRSPRGGGSRPRSPGCWCSPPARSLYLLSAPRRAAHPAAADLPVRRHPDRRPRPGGAGRWRRPAGADPARRAREPAVGADPPARPRAGDPEGVPGIRVPPAEARRCRGSPPASTGSSRPASRSTSRRAAATW